MLPTAVDFVVWISFYSSISSRRRRRRLLLLLLLVVTLGIFRLQGGVVLEACRRRLSSSCSKRLRFFLLLLWIVWNVPFDRGYQRKIAGLSVQVAGVTWSGLTDGVARGFQLRWCWRFCLSCWCRAYYFDLYSYSFLQTAAFLLSSFLLRKAFTVMRYSRRAVVLIWVASSWSQRPLSSRSSSNKNQTGWLAPSIPNIVDRDATECCQTYVLRRTGTPFDWWWWKAGRTMPEVDMFF